MAMGLFTDRPATASSGSESLRSARTNVEYATDQAQNAQHLTKINQEIEVSFISLKFHFKFSLLQTSKQVWFQRFKNLQLAHAS
jgi:hypothetical protein